MQNSLFNLRQSSIISEKRGYLSEKLKTLTSSNYHILFRSWVIDKAGFCEFVETKSFFGFGK